MQPASGRWVRTAPSCTSTNSRSRRTAARSSRMVSRTGTLRLAHRIFRTDRPASYSVFGTFVAGSEASGLLRLNSADGGLTQNALGQDRLTLRAALNTNTDSSDLDTGLKIDDTLGLTGLFNLSSLTGPLINGYGIRFTDRTAAGVNQAAELDVRFNPVTGKVEVRYILQDFDTNQIFERGLADFAPPNGADQILLQLTRPDIANTNFFASYSYLQGGNVRRRRSVRSTDKPVPGREFRPRRVSCVRVTARARTRHPRTARSRLRRHGGDASTQAVAGSPASNEPRFGGAFALRAASVQSAPRG